MSTSDLVCKKPYWLEMFHPQSSIKRICTFKLLFQINYVITEPYLLLFFPCCQTLFLLFLIAWVALRLDEAQNWKSQKLVYSHSVFTSSQAKRPLFFTHFSTSIIYHTWDLTKWLSTTWAWWRGVLGLVIAVRATIFFIILLRSWNHRSIYMHQILSYTLYVECMTTFIIGRPNNCFIWLVWL